MVTMIHMLQCFICRGYGHRAADCRQLVQYIKQPQRCCKKMTPANEKIEVNRHPTQTLKVDTVMHRR